MRILKLVKKVIKIDTNAFENKKTYAIQDERTFRPHKSRVYLYMFLFNVSVFDDARTFEFCGF